MSMVSKIESHTLPSEREWSNIFFTVNNFLETLSFLPLEVDLIRDSVYASSNTIDGRRFAEEYIRRRKLATQGIVLDSSTSHTSGNASGSEASSKVSGGWNEVAKKQKEAPVPATENANFKVVQPKKKGGKKT